MDNALYEQVEALKKEAEKREIPIMQEKGIKYVIDFLKDHSIRSVLEIGTAVGYSAIRMALSIPNLKITSIERDKDRYLEAVKHVKEFGLENRITLIFHDALEVELNETYDLILIDAAKAQNRKFFERFEKNLKERGFIITDNMAFHGLVGQDESTIKSKNLRALVRKIKDYTTFLEENKNYNTIFLSVGDGLAISEKKS